QMAKIIAYIKIARIDHWIKNAFVLPGVACALFLDSTISKEKLLLRVCIALLAAGLVASSNYVLNEILDANNDKKHPVKNNRPIPSGLVNIPAAYAEWIILAILGLSISLFIGKSFFFSGVLLWVMGCVYNIPPIRSKEKAYIDVLSESINNPIRFLMGWYAMGTNLIPPVSILFSYWMIGAFFMAVKRLAELRTIGDKKVAQAYRSSFAHYNEERLLISILFYVSMFSLFFGVFLMRYRIELILSIPFIAGFISWYMELGFKKNSSTQYPEKLYKEISFIIYTLFCTILILVLLFVDFPIVGKFFQKQV
ncbi:MAG: UbiA prenyltransferase family protein, partial [Patescibacteria group bacterium]